MKNYFGLFCLFVVTLSSSGVAQDTGLIDVSGDWSAFAVKLEGKPVCYMGSEPTKSEGKYTQRGDVVFLVTHRPADKAIGVINFQTGYTFKEGSDATLIIGDKSFALFTDEGDGWARDAKTDEAIIQAMIKGSQMVVKGVSSRGTQTTDTFSLKGFTAAYKAASKACKV
ncbi:MAG: invasion associated locus B family protein [Rhodospirillales bacterium]|nr:invasion associated locus B family protein [Rhodospirillales bacterium]